MSEYAVKEERSGWRDSELMARHRLYGWNCPISDIDGTLGEDGNFIDSIWFEYDTNEPVCFMEFKYGRAKIDPNAATTKTQKWIANACNKPLIGVEYYNTTRVDESGSDYEVWFFRLQALNTVAKITWLEQELEPHQKMTEQEYVKFYIG